MNYKEYKGNIFKEDTLLSNEYIIDKLYELDYCNEEIERLNKELESWIKLIDYKGIEDIPQYIEDLEVDNKSLKKENKEIDKENIRLNNIINKIEQYLIDVGVDDDILKCCGRYDVNGVEIRNYIEELKGSD